MQPAAVPEFEVLSTSPPPPQDNNDEDIEDPQRRGGGMRRTPSSRMSMTIARRQGGGSNAASGTTAGGSDDAKREDGRGMSVIVPPPLASHPGGTAALVVGSLGVVFGDIGTSPLYTLNTVIGVLLDDPANETSSLSDIVVAVYCLLFYSLFWVVSVKYVFWVMRVNHDGNGGALAMARVILNSLNETKNDNDTAVVKDTTNNNNNEDTAQAPAHQTTTTTTNHDDKSFIRKNKIVMIVAILSASFLIGDGVITPPNTVLGALTSPVINISKELNVLVSVIILLITFAVQRFGSMAIGKTFGPVMILWFATLAILGLLSIVQHPAEARLLLRAFNPACLSILGFKNVFYSLSGVILAVTGGEALYADLGHFGYKAIAIAWWTVAFPALAIQYYGQCCLVLSLESMNNAGITTRSLSGGGVSVHPSVPPNLVYALVPTDGMSETAGQACVWLLTILAILASVIASQALISGLFTILQQAYALDLVPRMNIMHTNPHEKGQVFISEINTMMCIACVLLVVIFQTSENLIASYGIAVAFCMFLTDVSMGFVMGWVYKCHWVVSILVCLPFLFVDGMFLSSNLLKLTVDPYAFTSIVISLVVFFFMQSHWWTKTTLKRVVGRGMNEGRMPGDLGATTIQTQITTAGLPTDIDNILHLLSESKLLKRMPVAGIFLTPFKQTAPVALSILARSLTALPETIILWHVSFLADKPFVSDHERYDLTCHSEELGVYSLNMYFGYCEPITADDFDVNNSISEIFSFEGYPALQKLVDEDRISKSSRILFAPFQNEVEERTANWTYFLPVRKYIPDPKENVLHKLYVYTCDFLTRNSKPSREFFGLSSLDTIEMSVVTRINSKDKTE